MQMTKCGFWKKSNHCPEAVIRHNYFVFKIKVFDDEQMAEKVEVAIAM